MWQEILVFIILAVGAGFTLQKIYRTVTGKASCCGGGCTCKGSCGSDSSAKSAKTGGCCGSGNPGSGLNKHAQRCQIAG